MWQVPYLICVGVLAALLLARESQHARIQRHLIDKILVSKGSEELPASPVEKLMDNIAESRKPYPKDKALAELEKRIERKRDAIHFNIPGMPQFKDKA
jgi:hypothetical protein